MSEAVKRYCMRAFGSIVQPIEVPYSGTWVPSADHDRIVSALTEGGRKMQAERDRLAERCRELEEDQKDRDQECARMLNEAWGERDTLRAEVEQLTTLQLPPGHLPMPRRMLELLIGDPQDPYRANAESVASEMLSGALPDPASHEREFNAVRNVRLLLAEVDRLRAANAELSEINAARRRHLENAKKAAGIGPTDDLVGAIERLSKDAERYRWLRDRMAVEDIPGEHPAWSQPSEFESAKVDTAVDAALEASR